MKLIKFRPSSHSTDYTFISVFKRREAAWLAKKALLKNFQEFFGEASEINVETRDEKLLVSLYTNHLYPKKLLQLLRTMKDLQRIYKFSYAPYIEVTVTLPQKASVALAPLLLPTKQAEALRKLMEWCTVTVTAGKRKTTVKLTWDLTEDEYGYVIKTLFGRECVVGRDYDEAVIDMRWKDWKVTEIPSNPSKLQSYQVIFDRTVGKAGRKGRNALETRENASERLE